jgi:hypothetical protein
MRHDPDGADHHQQNNQNTECERERVVGVSADLFDESRTKTVALRQVEAYARKYHFFHYEVAFPEAFSGGSQGFDIIVGNLN